MPTLFSFWFKALRWLGKMLFDGLVIGLGIVMLVSGGVIWLLAYMLLIVPGATLLGLPVLGPPVWEEQPPPWEEEYDYGAGEYAY